MKLFKIKLLFVLGVLVLQGCKKEIEPRPLADLNLLAGKWVTGSQEVDFDVSKRQAVITKIGSNQFGFKVGDIKLKNVEAVDEKTFRGESMYRASTGYFMYADIKITVNGDVMTYTSNAGSISGISVTGQSGTYNRPN